MLGRAIDHNLNTSTAWHQSFHTNRFTYAFPFIAPCSYYSPALITFCDSETINQCEGIANSKGARDVKLAVGYIQYHLR